MLWIEPIFTKGSAAAGGSTAGASADATASAGCLTSKGVGAPAAFETCGGADAGGCVAGTGAAGFGCGGGNALGAGVGSGGWFGSSRRPSLDEPHPICNARASLLEFNIIMDLNPKPG